MTTSSDNNVCGPVEATIRTILFFGFFIGGACLLWFGPRAPENGVTGGIGIALILCSALAFIPIKRKSQSKAKPP